MTHRIVVFAVAELAIDPNGIGAALTDACRRGRRGSRVCGVCPVGDRVYFLLRELSRSEPRETYVLIEVDDVTHAGVTALLNDRWHAGFQAIGTVPLGESSALMILAQSPDEAE